MSTRRVLLSAAVLLLVCGAGAAVYYRRFPERLPDALRERGPMATTFRPQDGPTTKRPSLWLLSIGVSEYEDSRLDLAYADDDARAIAAALEEQAGGKIYREVHARLLVNESVTRESILGGMSTFLGRAGPNDVVALFLAGHGVQDGTTGTYYFMPHSATPETLLTAGLRMSDFNELVVMLRQNVRRVVLMLDTCHAGALRFDTRAVRSASDLAAKISKGEGLYLLAAAKPGESSRENPALGQGVFTHALLGGLSGLADTDADLFVSLSELFGHVADRVPRLTDGQQHPYQEISGTDLVFAALHDKEERQAAATDDDEAPVREKEEFELLPNRIAVLQFRNERKDDPENEWIRNALQTAFTTELNKVEGLEVYSPEYLDEVAGGRSKFQAAKSLGASRVVTGSYAIFGGQIRLDARVVDVGTGLQESAESVQGEFNDFLNLEKKIALSTLDRLQIEVSEAERAAIAAKNESEDADAAIDALKLILQGEGRAKKSGGGGAESASPARDEPPDSSSLLRWPFAAGVAHAVEKTPEEEIRSILELYRRALQDRDIEAVRKLWGELTATQREGLEQYFANARNLQVEFKSIKIRRLDAERFAVSYVRHDTFNDSKSGKSVSLEIQLENAVERQDGGWRVTLLGGEGD